MGDSNLKMADKLLNLDVPITSISVNHLPEEFPSFRIEGIMTCKQHHDIVNEFIEDKQRFFKTDKPTFKKWLSDWFKCGESK